MKAYEAAKKLGIDNKAFIEEYGLKSHLSRVPDELEAELFGSEKKIVEEQAQPQTVDSSETVVVGDAGEPDPELTVSAKKPVTSEQVKGECPFPLDVVRRQIRMNGNKSKCWQWRHLVDG